MPAQTETHQPSTDRPEPPRRRRRVLGRVLLAGGLVLLVLAAVVLWPQGSGEERTPAVSAAASAGPVEPADPLAADIARTQRHLKRVPKDWQAWATLGLYYVEQGRITVDPTYYPKAEKALERSLRLNGTQNFVAMAGQAALASARHDFAGALSWAKRGLAINSYSAVLYGALNDALTQLGRYDEAAAAARRMNELRPGTSAFARASYVFELRGNVPRAISSMERARGAAGSRADIAFADRYLAMLAFHSGDYDGALRYVAHGLRAVSGDAALLAARARTEAALGQTDAALRDYATVVDRVPQPQYVLEYGELLQSLGRTQEAQRQYALFRSEEQLFVANGVALDVDQTLFEANHGDPAKALAAGKAGLAIRPFVATHDAYAWALHINGRDMEALAESRKALATGMRNALFYFHKGMIEKSLGDVDAARHDLATALEINPHFSPLQAPRATAALAELGGPS